jgi:hypothetical protein
MMSAARNRFAAALLLLSPFPASAETLVWGQANLATGLGKVVGSFGNGDSISDETVGSTEFLGRLGADFGAFGAEVDLSYSGQEVPLSDSAFYFGRYISVRANYDLSDALTIGAVYGDGVSQPFGDLRANLTFKAVEGAYTTGPSSFGLQFGVFDADDQDTFHNGRFVRVSAVHALRNGGLIEGEIGLFSGRQETGSEFAMQATTWRIGYSRQIGSKPLAVSVGLDGGSYSNGQGDSDNGSYDEVRVTLGLTAWFGDGDFASAKRRGVFGQPEFGRIVSAGSNLD